MSLYIEWTDWRLHYKVKTYRLCEMSFKHYELVIGPFWFERTVWI